MGMIITCDVDDCRNMDFNYDGKIYYIADKALKEKLGFLHEDNICQECVDQYNADYGDMIIVDPEDEDYVILNPDYKE